MRKVSKSEEGGWPEVEDVEGTEEAVDNVSEAREGMEKAEPEVGRIGDSELESETEPEPDSSKGINRECWSWEGGGVCSTFRVESEEREVREAKGRETWEERFRDS